MYWRYPLTAREKLTVIIRVNSKHKTGHEFNLTPDQNISGAFDCLGKIDMGFALHGSWFRTYLIDGVGAVRDCFVRKVAPGVDTVRIQIAKALSIVPEGGALWSYGLHKNTNLRLCMKTIVSDPNL